MKLRHLLFAASAAVFGVLATLAAGQVLIPTVTNVGTSDLFQDIVGGYARQGNAYATAAQISGLIGYSDQGVLATGQSLTFGNSTALILARSSATIAALTLTTSASPGDGQQNCYFNTQTTTAITWTANTGQTLSGAPTAGVANTKQCMLYEAATATWYRAQ